MKFLEDMTTDEKCAVIRKRGGDAEHLPDILLELQRLSRNNALDSPTLELVAESLNLLKADVMDVAGFYAMLNTEPSARYILEVCRSNPCAISRSQSIVEQLTLELGIAPYEITEDGMFTIRFMNCAGACDIGPVIRVGDQLYGNLTSEKISTLIAELRNRK